MTLEELLNLIDEETYTDEEKLELLFGYNPYENSNDPEVIDLEIKTIHQRVVSLT